MRKLPRRKPARRSRRRSSQPPQRRQDLPFAATAHQTKHCSTASRCTAPAPAPFQLIAPATRCTRGSRGPPPRCAGATHKGLGAKWTEPRCATWTAARTELHPRIARHSPPFSPEDRHFVLSSSLRAILLSKSLGSSGDSVILSVFPEAQEESCKPA